MGDDEICLHHSQAVMIVTDQELPDTVKEEDAQEYVQVVVVVDVLVVVVVDVVVVVVEVVARNSCNLLVSFFKVSIWCAM